MQIVTEVRAKSNSQIFQQRMRCKAFADKYVKDSSNDLNHVIVIQIQLSYSRNSCVAEVVEHFSTKPIAGDLALHGANPDEFKVVEHYNYKVVDLLTAEDLFTRICTDSQECLEAIDKQGHAFKEVR